MADGVVSALGTEKRSMRSGDAPIVMGDNRLVDVRWGDTKVFSDELVRSRNPVLGIATTDFLGWSARVLRRHTAIIAP